jgi:two-component system, NtrC family, response regulator PilR
VQERLIRVPVDPTLPGVVLAELQFLVLALAMSGLNAERGLPLKRLEAIASPPLQIAPALLAAAPVCAALWQDVTCATRSNAPALITGGTKRIREAIGRVIHQQGPLADEPFAVVCARQLAEMFSDRSRPCLSLRGIGTAPGTLFMADDVCDLSLQMQESLRRFLEENSRQQIRQSGCMAVRVIATSARPVFESVAAGTFSSELFYRLNLIHVVIPRHAQRGVT